MNDFANDTDADLTAYVQMYRTRIADMTHEIEDKVSGPIDEVMRDAIARLKWERDEERERLEQVKDEQKRRTATSKVVSVAFANNQRPDSKGRLTARTNGTRTETRRVFDPKTQPGKKRKSRYPIGGPDTTSVCRLPNPCRFTWQ